MSAHKILPIMAFVFCLSCAAAGTSCSKDKDDPIFFPPTGTSTGTGTNTGTGTGTETGTGTGSGTGTTLTIFATDLESETTAEPANAIELIRVNNNPYIVDYMDIWYEGGIETDRYARIVPDPDNASNNVLHFWLKNAAILNPRWGTFKGRVQAGLSPYLYEEIKETTNIVQTHRMFLHPDLEYYKTYPDENTWFVLYELWIGTSWRNHPYPFLIGLNIAKPAGNNTELYFYTHARGYNYQDKQWNETVWWEVNPTFTVPMGEWLDVRIEYKQGNESAGRFVVKIKRENAPDYETIFDITNWTYNPKSPTPVPVTQINPLKLYTSDKIIKHITDNSGVAQIYWDDLKVTTVK